MSVSYVPTEEDVRSYLTVLWRKKWTVLAVFVLVLAPVLAVSVRQTPRYEAVAEVVVQTPAAPGEPANPPQPGEMETERRVVASTAVAERVRNDLDLESAPNLLLQGLEVRVLPDSHVLELAYTSTDPDRAARIVNSFAANYLSHREERGLEGVVAERTSLEDRLAETDERLTKIGLQLRQIEAGDPAVGTLETQRNILIGRSAVLQERLEDLRAAGAARQGVGEVIAVATPPTSPASPDHVFNTILGGALGLLLGSGAALANARREDRFRDRTDVERTLEAPVLATIPKYPLPKTKSSSRLVTAVSPVSVASESYRTLRTSIQFLTSEQGNRSILFTSSSAGEGKSLTVGNLGMVFAQAGKRVVLVSADLRRPTLGNYFGLADGEESEGLSTWLASNSPDPTILLKESGFPNLRVLATGPLPSNPTELLSSPHLMHLISRLEASSDLVLFDSPPILAVSDAAILASRVNSVALIVGPGTDRSAAAQAREQVQRVGSTVIGVILNSLDPSFVPGYANSQGYYGQPPQGSRGEGGRRDIHRETRLARVLRSNR